MLNVFTLDERMFRIRKYFGVDFHCYGRKSRGVLLSSGCGIGLALMDICKKLNWFVDVDNYRNTEIDWESLAVILSAGCPSKIVLVGWFTIDTPKAFDEFTKGVPKKTPLLRYSGGGETSLGEFLKTL